MEGVGLFKIKSWKRKHPQIFNATAMIDDCRTKTTTMGKKKQQTSSSSSTDSSSSTPPLVVTTPISKPSSSSAAKKKHLKGMEQFLSDVLPNLKKEMLRKKKEPFDLAAYNDYFKSDSGYLATFILPLFHFTAKNEVICTRYGNFDGKHAVKTTAGFDRVMLISKNSDPEQFTPELEAYCMQRFGREWFKIPSKDSFRAKAAASAGHDGQFKVVLTGVYFDSFISKENTEVETINPILAYEPVRPPPPKKEKVPKAAVSSSSPKENPTVTVVPPPAIGQPEEDSIPLLEED